MLLLILSDGSRSLESGPLPHHAVESHAARPQPRLRTQYAVRHDLAGGASVVASRSPMGSAGSRDTRCPHSSTSERLQPVSDCRSDFAYMERGVDGLSGDLTE